MKLVETIIFASLMTATTSAFAIEQTICFSQDSERRSASLGDTATLFGGKCQGVKLEDMNAKGWRLVQVVPDLFNSFGMVFEKVGPANASASKPKNKN